MRPEFFIQDMIEMISLADREITTTFHNLDK